MLIALVVILLSPRAVEYTRSAVENLLGNQPYPFGPRNTFDFLAVCGIAVCVAFALPTERLRRVVRVYRRAAGAGITIELVPTWFPQVGWG
jgi:hypothetical protein